MNDNSTRIRRAELYKEVWTTPIHQLAKKYGLSDVGLAKICKRYNIPEASPEVLGEKGSRAKGGAIVPFSRRGPDDHHRRTAGSPGPEPAVDVRRGVPAGGKAKRIKMIHILAKHGAKWHPGNPAEIAEARRCLLKMKADYTVEFIWIMAKYQEAKRKDIEELLRTPSIRSVISKYSDRVAEMKRLLH